MKNSKIIFLILSLFYCAAGYAYHWDMDDDYYDESTWWDEDMDRSEWMDDIVVTGDYDDYDPYYDASYEYYLDSLDDDDWDNDDRNDDWEDNSSGSNHNTKEAEPEDDKSAIEKIIEDLIDQLQLAMNIQFPITVYVGDKIETLGRFYGRVLEDGTIEIYVLFTNLTSEGDQMSVLYHEYFHYTNDKTVGRDENGYFIRVETEEKVNYTDEEIQYFKKQCENHYKDTDIHQYYIDECVKYELNELYVYKPSNYFENEINAYNAELEAEKDGYYDLSDKYRNETLDKLEGLKIQYNLAVEYEKNNGLNPDGTKK